MTQRTVLYGVSPVHQCLLHQNRPCHELFMKKVAGSSPRLQEIHKLAREKEIPVRETDPHGLAKITGTKIHQGVALICGALKTHSLDEIMSALDGSSPRLIIALDQLEDPQNVGAIIRTAAFLGADALITLKNRSAPLSPTVSKASAGALEYFPIIEVTNLAESLKQLKKQGFFVWGASLSDDSVPFTRASLTDWKVLVVGNEGSGLRQLTEKRCDQLIHIPGKSDTESLNVSAAAAILIQHFVAST